MKASLYLNYNRKEREALSLTRDNIVRSLNSEMAEKANVQIVLNETKEKLQETNEMVNHQLKNTILNTRLKANNSQMFFTDGKY